MERHNDYFEGILQLRNVDEGMVQFVLNKFERDKVGIARIVEQGNGLDIYSASNKFIRQIGKKLVSMFGGELKVSPKLFSKSRLTSRNIYRLSVSYRAPEIRRGQIVAEKDKIVEVSSIIKTQIRGTDIISGARTSLLVKAVKVLEPRKAIVVKIKPRIEIMDPDTFQSIAAENKKAGLNVNQEVKIVIYRKKLYIL